MVKLIVKESKIAGKGCFAAEDILKGTTVGEYTGPIITDEQGDELYDNAEHFYLFSIDGGKCIDATNIEHEMKYLNHCCNPNCEAIEDEGRVFYHALKDIQTGEELTVDYHLISDEEDKCLCGTQECRGTMRVLEEEQE